MRRDAWRSVRRRMEEREERRMEEREKRRMEEREETHGGA